MVAMSFFLVKNYRMTEAFEFVNWQRMLIAGFFWDSYLVHDLASPAVERSARCASPFPLHLRWRSALPKVPSAVAIFLLIIPFFTSYLVRTFSWFVILCRKRRGERGAWVMSGLAPTRC